MSARAHWMIALGGMEDGRMGERLDALRKLIKARGYAAAVLAKPANIAALFRGAQVSLGFRQEAPGRIAICVSPDRITVLGNQTEVARVAQDELSWLQGVVERPVRWDEWNLKASVKEYLDRERIEPVCDDVKMFGVSIEDDLVAEHYPLREQEAIALRKLARDTARTLEAVAKGVVAGATEAAIAGRLTGELASQGICPELVMVAADERIGKFRHIVPKAVRVRQLALLSATVHRRGLYVSLTRLVSLGPVPPEWRDRQAACNRIDAQAISLSEPGKPVGEIFEAMVQGYGAEGFPDEWKAHHQGGPAGFYGRDYKATWDEERKLFERQPVVWNPTVCGAKSEDTILTRGTGEPLEILTETGNWPYCKVALGGTTLSRPMIFEK